MRTREISKNTLPAKRFRLRNKIILCAGLVFRHGGLASLTSKIGMKIKVNDTVKIISGKDRGKTGKITHVLVEENRIVVEGVNIAKKHSKPKKQGQKGQIIQMPMPISVSNAMVVCSSCSKPTRVGKKTVGSKKVRACKRCGGEL